MGGRRVDQGWMPIRWPCELCGAPAGASGICLPCRADLPWLGSACPGCGRPLAGPGHCARCLAEPRPWSRVIVPLAWRFPVDVLIGRFKYGGALHYGALLGRLLGECCGDRPGPSPEGLVPVPLHPARRAGRGFNQAHELAREVARATGVAVLADACRREVDARPQVGLAASARYRNLAGAFVAGDGVAGLRLAVVDDVLTTGSSAAAGTLARRQAGAAGGAGWGGARGGPAGGGAATAGPAQAGWKV